MKKKNVLVIILTGLIVLSGAVLGVANVYRINSVCVQAPTVSMQAKTEAEALKARLEEAYHGENAWFATRDFADEIVADFPYFRITSFEKAYPNRIIVEVTEDAEYFALPTVETNQTYYILNVDGTVLDIRSDMKNRVDGYDNLLITGLSVTGEKGENLPGDPLLETAVSLCGKLSQLFDGIRRNIVKIEVMKPTSSIEESVLRVHMREGVILYVENPTSKTEEKAQMAFDKYMGISSAQRLHGTIAVVDGENGVLAEYFQEEW